MPSAAAQQDAPELLQRLQSLCRDRGDMGALTLRLADLADLVATDMASFEASTPRLRPEAHAVERGAMHLIDLGGKRLRPICVALASRLGSGFDERTLDLAISVELVHAATLLHDDVVDVGDQRRGAPAARMIFGNAVSIFAGDWLLIEALRRVQRTGLTDVLTRLFDVIEEMIFAESLQLERRGRLDISVNQWFEVVDGKTAALFRWAMYAGGRAGGLSAEECDVLERYGAHLGAAFQCIDDVLDLAGDPLVTGKALFTDLREGKLTYPLIIAAERSPEVHSLLKDFLSSEDEAPATAARIFELVRETGALDEGRRFAIDHAHRTKAILQFLPKSRARDALETVADAVVHRPA